MQAANQAFWILLVILLACTVGLETTSAQQSDKPHILFILNDNTGYGDIGVYGGGESRGAPTPRIDRLASEGLRMTQFLVEPGCTPSRAALMTGRYSIRSGLSLVTVEGSALSLPRSEITIAEMEGDAVVGTLLDALENLGLKDNTILRRIRASSSTSARSMNGS